MDRVGVLSAHVRKGLDSPSQAPLDTSATSASGIKVFPAGKKHFVTNPWERLARYEGDGGASKAITLCEAFTDRVKAIGTLPVLKQKQGARDGPWTTWTWNDLYTESLRVSRALMALGCEQHTAINILGFNSPEWFFTAMGGICAGLTPAGVYITNGPDGCEYILNHSKATVMFVDSDPQLQKILAIRGKCPSLKAIVHWGADCPADGSQDGVMSWKKFISLADKTPTSALDDRIKKIHPDNCCYLSYTSGTTGNPKAVMYSHDNIIWSMRRLIISTIADSAGGFGLEEREISYLPLSHIAGNIQLLGSVVMPPTMNSIVHFAFPDAMQGSLPDTIREVRPTHFIGVPRVWEKLFMGLKQLQAKPELKADPMKLRAVLGLDQVRVSVTGAAPISKDIMEFFDTLHMPLLEVYGMTENTAYSHFNHKNKRRIGSVGPALVDEGAGAKIDAASGEIRTWSRGVMMGYMYMPEKTADTFDDEGFLCTGDIGEVREGFTFITGRIKEMIITAGGENVAPVLLENAIKERLPAISNVVTIGDKQKYLVALMTLKLEPNATGGFTNKLFAEALAVDPACKTYEEAMASPIWKEYLAKGIEAANGVAVSRAQHTRKYTVIPGDFSPIGEMAELTPTMKLRREIFHKKHLDVLKKIYGDDLQAF